MKMHWIRKAMALCMALCLMAGCLSTAGAEAAPGMDWDTLKPLMDLVACATLSAGDEPEIVGNEETTLTPVFISAFFNCGLTADASLGLNEGMLTNPEQQSAVLTHFFAAKLPALENIAKTIPPEGYIGFMPVQVNALDDTNTQVLGEVYWGEKAMAQMTPADYKNVQWLDRGVFSFRADAAAFQGQRLTGFSIGAELNMEEAIQAYTESILVEYINTTLGFSILYPSVFTDDMLVEDGDGVTARLPDDSLSFFVRRTANATGANLADYTSVIANGIPASQYTVNDPLSYSTVMYDTQEGYTVFDMYIITDKYIYQAELSFRTELAYTYQMYTAYLENSFAVDEVSMG